MHEKAGLQKTNFQDAFVCDIHVAPLNLIEN